MNFTNTVIRIFQPYRITVKRGNMKDSSTPVAGSDFATGRPATGRNRGLSVRVSEEAYNFVKREKNKSEYIDRLIIEDNKKRGRQD